MAIAIDYKQRVAARSSTQKLRIQRTDAERDEKYLVCNISEIFIVFVSKMKSFTEISIN